MPPAFNLSQDQTLHLSFRQLSPSRTKAIYLSEALNPNQSKLITDFLLGGTLALLGQVIDSPAQGVHTIHLCTLSKIQPPRSFPLRTFRPGEPTTIHRLFGPSTPHAGETLREVGTPALRRLRRLVKGEENHSAAPPGREGGRAKFPAQNRHQAVIHSPASPIPWRYPAETTDRRLVACAVLRRLHVIA